MFGASHRYLRRFLYDGPFDSQAKDTTQHTQLPVDSADGEPFRFSIYAVVGYMFAGDFVEWQPSNSMCG